MAHFALSYMLRNSTLESGEVTEGRSWKLYNYAKIFLGPRQGQWDVIRTVLGKLENVVVL
jgi:hypothetical protein